MINKIKINLNPKVKEKESLFIQKISFYTPFVGLGVVGFFIVLLFFQILIFFKANAYRNYRKEWKRWEKNFNLINNIKKETAALLQEKKEFEKLTTPKIVIAKIFEDIFSSLPENIWFHTLSFKEDSLNLKGYVVKWNNEDDMVSLHKFITSLKEKEYFSSKFKRINIIDSKKVSFFGVEVLEFNVECKK
jgi:Tfp pilus assembly protein PilN